MAEYFRTPPRTTDYGYVCITSDQDQVNHLEFFEVKEDCLEAAKVNITPGTPTMACRIMKSGHDTTPARMALITVMASLSEADINALVGAGAKRSRKGLQEVLSALLDQAIQNVKKGKLP